MTRRTMVRAHARRIYEPEAYARVHLELIEAYQIDQINRDVAERIAAEVERDLRDERS